MVLKTTSGWVATILSTAVPHSPLSRVWYSSPRTSMPCAAAYCLMILFAVRGKT